MKSIFGREKKASSSSGTDVESSVTALFEATKVFAKDIDNLRKELNMEGSTIALNVSGKSKIDANPAGYARRLEELSARYNGLLRMKTKLDETLKSEDIKEKDMAKLKPLLLSIPANLESHLSYDTSNRTQKIFDVIQAATVDHRTASKPIESSFNALDTAASLVDSARQLFNEVELFRKSLGANDILTKMSQDADHVIKLKPQDFLNKIHLIKAKYQELKNKIDSFDYPENMITNDTEKLGMLLRSAKALIEAQLSYDTSNRTQKLIDMVEQKAGEALAVQTESMSKPGTQSIWTAAKPNVSNASSVEEPRDDSGESEHPGKHG